MRLREILLLPPWFPCSFQAVALSGNDGHDGIREQLIPYATRTSITGLSDLDKGGEEEEAEGAREKLFQNIVDKKSRRLEESIPAAASMKPSSRPEDWRFPSQDHITLISCVCSDALVLQIHPLGSNHLDLFQHAACLVNRDKLSISLCRCTFHRRLVDEMAFARFADALLMFCAFTVVKPLAVTSVSSYFVH